MCSCGLKNSGSVSYREIPSGVTAGDLFGTYYDTMTKTTLWDRDQLRNNTKQQLYFLNCIDQPALIMAFKNAGIMMDGVNSDLDQLAMWIDNGSDKNGSVTDANGKPIVFDGKAVMNSIQPSLEKMNASSCSVTFFGH